MSKQSELNQLPLEQKSYSSYEELYEDIPVEGSLGILAMGAAGVIPWRIKREKAGVKPSFIMSPEDRDKDENQDHDET